MQVNSLHIP
jgi:hypothetical protein